MMKRCILTIILVLITGTCSAADYGLIVFSASWCGPCRQLKSVMASPQVDAYLDKVRRYDVDIDVDRISASAYRVRSVPTIILIEERDGYGYEISRHVGVMNSQLLQKFVSPIPSVNK